MDAITHYNDLLLALERQEQLKQKGYEAYGGLAGDVVVGRFNHVRGVWHFRGGCYFWTAAGHSEPTFRADTLEKAVAFTLHEVAGS